jgi:hypothetical protein
VYIASLAKNLISGLSYSLALVVREVYRKCSLTVSRSVNASQCQVGAELTRVELHGSAPGRAMTASSRSSLVNVTNTQVSFDQHAIMAS